MAGYIGTFVAKKILGEHLENKFGQEDPYFETVPATRLDGRPSTKTKRVRKALPPGLSDHDAKVLTKVKRRAYRLDSSFGSCCGIKFGWSSVIGIFPVVGDVIDALLALMVVRSCQKIEGGLPSGLKIQMLFWVFVDFVVGLVPFVGDIMDAVVRANTKNAILLESHLRAKGIKNLKTRGLPVPDVDPSDADAFDRYDEEAARGKVTSQPSRHEGMTAKKPQQPANAKVRDDRQGSGSLFGFGGSKKSRPHDIEEGVRTQPSRTKSSRK